MTAEVAVLNKSGIALAADSAVTTGFPGREKIFTTANKIFTLSKIHPVGIMINGHVEHFGCPWEVIIKEFRSKLGSRKFDDLRGYVDAFAEAIKHKSYLSEDGQTVSVLMSTLSTAGELGKRIAEESLRWSDEHIRATLEGMLANAEERESIEEFADVSLKDFERRYGSIVNDIVANTEHIPKSIPKKCRPLFRRVVFSALTRQMNSQFNTGIVIAGYGENNRFPKLFEITVDGGFLDRVRYYDVEECDIATEPDGAAISTFAQDDTVHTLLNGIDDRFNFLHAGLFSHLMSLVADELLKVNTHLSSDERIVALGMLKRSIGDAVEDFFEESRAFSDETFRRPVLEVLRTAPKETLAELAESLVSITSLRQRVSGELETVGGPVDVALISKGEGFIWMKRKHYFDPKLNPHFDRNYFREMEK